MEQLRSREAREAEVYKRELVAWFKEQKKEQDQSRMLEEHTAKERFKVHRRYETSFERSSVDRFFVCMSKHPKRGLAGSYLHIHHITAPRPLLESKSHCVVYVRGE